MIENGQPDGSYLLRYVGLVIPFQLQFRQRKQLAITVHPEMKLVVVAPQGAPLDQVLARIEKQASWIVRCALAYLRLIGWLNIAVPRGWGTEPG